MKPLSGLVEINDDLLAERQNIIREDLIGLGPPELICLHKYQVKNTFTSYHHVCGFPMGGENEILEYFSLLLKSRPKRFFGKVRYDISESQFCIWNSFLHYDVRVIVKDKNIKSITIRTPSEYGNDNSNKGKNKNKIPKKMTASSWNELRLSSMLRFWMSPSPIFRSIYNYPYKYSPALRLITPPNFSDDDIRYIVDNHKASPELEAALACYLISTSSNIKKLKQLLTDIILPNFPRVICHFVSLFPHSCSPNLSKEFTILSNFAYQRMVDDVYLAFSSVNFAIEMNDISMCSSAIPILLNSLWASPEACCGMAKIAVYRGSASDALYFANAACFARKFRLGNPDTLDFITPKLESKKAPRARPKAIETELVASQQTDGHYYLIYKTIVSITSIASSIKIRAMLKSKFGISNNLVSSHSGSSVSRDRNVSNKSNFNKSQNKKRSNRHKNRHSSNNNRNDSTKSSSYLSSYSFDSDYDNSDSNYNSNSNSNSNSNTASRNRCSLSSITTSNLNDEYYSIKNMSISQYNNFCGYPAQPESDDSGLLFDPGVVTDSPDVPVFLRKFPMNEDFSEISSAALSDIQLRDTIMRTRRIDPSQDARKVVIVALKLCDSELFEVALNSLKKLKKDITLAELMKIRTNEGKNWSAIKIVDATLIPKMSINEYNTMILMSQISQGVLNIIEDDKNNSKK